MSRDGDWPEQLPDDAATGRHHQFVQDAQRALPDDLVIWNHQRSLARPALASVEAGSWRRLPGLVGTRAR